MSINPRIKTLILMNTKILNRYMKLYWLFFFVAVYIAILYYIKQQYVAESNVLISTTTFNYLVTGFLFIRLFVEGKNEKVFYFMFPIDFEEVVIVKNISVFIMVFALFCSAVFVETLLYKLSLRDVFDATTYFSSSIFIFFVIGNYVSVRLTMQYSTSKVIVFTIIQASVIIVASLPYFVLKVLLQNYALCFAFFLASLTCWYFVSIPSASRMIQKNKFDLIGDEK